MNYIRRRRKLQLQLAAFCAVFAIALAVCVGVVVRAVNPSIPAVVVDGEDTYQVRVGRLRQEDILDEAQKQGMPDLGPQDELEFVEDTATVTLRRKVEMFVSDQDETLSLWAYRGDTVEQALAGNDIRLKAEDQVNPGRETVVAAALTVEIQRCCRVTVEVGGETLELKLFGGTVADALEEAGVKMTENMACNYYMEEPLEDGMALEVKQLTTIQLVVDGKAEEYKISAGTVGEALERCDVRLGEEDRVTPAKDRPLRSGMRIVVQRVETVEEVETEEIPFGTQFVSSQDLSAGKTQRLSAGLKGEKELTYQTVYVDGEVESKELLSEEIKAEPVKEIIMRGIGQATTTTAPKLEFIDDGSGYTSSSQSPSSSSGTSSGSGKKTAVTVNAEAGTLTDPWGNEYAFSKTISGTCTAYCVPGGTTSTGMTSQRGVIAVNPNVIPYGTRIYAVSPDGKTVYGYGVAGDTGGACMDGIILADLCYDSEEECIVFGRREMVLYILQ